MKAPTVFALTLLVLFVFSACGDSSENDSAGATPGDPEAASTDPCPSLLGSWELVSIAETSSALSGEFESDPDYQESPTLKILNETHWMFIRQSAESFIHSQGGRYTLEPGGFYTEYVEYSAIKENIGQQFRFDCRLEGDSLWHHVGGQGDARYDEIWRRVR